MTETTTTKYTPLIFPKGEIVHKLLSRILVASLVAGGFTLFANSSSVQAPSGQPQAPSRRLSDASASRAARVYVLASLSSP